MRLRAKSRHFPKRADDGFVNQLYQIIGEFEVLEKICFRFISNRQTDAKRTQKFCGEETRLAFNLTRFLLFLILQELRFLRERIVLRFQVLQAFLNIALGPIGTSVSSGRLYSI